MSKAKSTPTSKALARVSRDLTPHALAVTPATIPPPVLRNPRKHIVVDIDSVMPATGNLSIGLAFVREQIALQTGLVGEMYITLQYIHVWGPITPAGSSSVELTEPIYGLTVTGDNTTTTRSRCGLMYPKNVQPTWGPQILGSAVDLCTISRAPPTTNVTLRIGLDFWATPNASAYSRHHLANLIKALKQGPRK